MNFDKNRQDFKKLPQENCGVSVNFALIARSAEAAEAHLRFAADEYDEQQRAAGKWRKPISYRDLK